MNERELDQVSRASDLEPTTAQLIAQWLSALALERRAAQERRDAEQHWERAVRRTVEAQRRLYARLAAPDGQEPTAHRHLGCVVWAEGGQVRALRLAGDLA